MLWLLLSLYVLVGLAVGLWIAPRDFSPPWLVQCALQGAPLAIFVAVAATAKWYAQRRQGVRPSTAVPPSRVTTTPDAGDGDEPPDHLCGVCHRRHSEAWRPGRSTELTCGGCGRGLGDLGPFVGPGAQHHAVDA
jgi:hypothetical protein